MLSSGNRLGPYEIVALLGSGGMGDVFRARDTQLDRDVAVKVLPERVAGDPAALARFKREAKAVAALSHPNILAIHDFGTQDDVAYAVTELLQGETLRERLAAGALPLRKAIDYAVQTTQGLAAAHEKGIVHRDLKPENLFLTRDGRVKILDFGLARRQPMPGPADTESPTLSHYTEPGTVLGTVGYMSPEQVRGEAADHRSDIFSFGVVVHEMLAGKRAFRGATPADTMRAILREDPPNIDRADLPPALARILERCLDKRAEERFQTARDVGFALEALSGASGGAQARGSPVRRHLRTVATVAAALILAMAAFVAGRGRAPTPMPSARQLTFRRGVIQSGRFAPDGRTIVYSAAWEGLPPEIFATTSDGPESRSLGLAPAILASVSSAGELALLRRSNPQPPDVPPPATLARVSLAGGAPRDLLEDVQFADWAPDGRGFCVARRVQGQEQIELPPGKILYRSSQNVGWPRVSPSGDQVAFVSWEGAGGTVTVVDGNGKTTVLGSFPAINGLAWSARGDEVWVAAGSTPSTRALRALTLAGKERLVYRIAGTMTLLDVSREGRVLLAHGFVRVGVMAVAPGETVERDVSAFDRCLLAGLSADGRAVLLSEAGAASGPVGSAYLRGTDGSAAVHVTEGISFDLSRDGKWALVELPGKPSRMSLVPTGAGAPRDVPLGRIEPDDARLFPDGRRVLVEGIEGGQRGRRGLFVLDPNSGGIQRLEGESAEGGLSPDGMLVATRDHDGKAAVLPIGGGASREIRGLVSGDTIIGWSANGKSVFVQGPGYTEVRIYRLDLSSGRRELWKKVGPSDPAGVTFVAAGRISDDARSYAYTYARHLLDLFVVDGLK
jgi:hypothetical protein